MKLVSNDINNPPDTPEGMRVVDLVFTNRPVINGQDESSYRLLMKEEHARELAKKVFYDIHVEQADKWWKE